MDALQQHESCSYILLLAALVYLCLGAIVHSGGVSKGCGDFDHCLDRKGAWLVQRWICFLDVGSFYVP